MSALNSVTPSPLAALRWWSGAHKTAPNQAGAAFVYELNGTTWTQKAKLDAGVSAAANDHFGYSVAISGDTIVVGAPSNFALPNPGSAYVFVRNGMTWMEQKKLTGGKSGDEFGRSVAIQANTLVVGARYVDLPNPNMISTIEKDAGSAYIFRRSGTGVMAVWTPIPQQLIPRTTAPGISPPSIANDHFGESVAINGNFIAVGAAGDDDPQGAAGAVYVYVQSVVGGSYGPQQKLIILNGANGDRFGYSVALEGNTLIAGAPYAPNISLTAPTALGAAYVFEFNGATWIPQGKLVATGGATGDLFGWSVAVSNNVIAVGAPGDDTAAGSAYVFMRSGSAWTEIQKLVLALAQRLNGDRFGDSVAWSFGNLVVGAAEKPLNPGQGAAYYFVPDDSIWLVGFGLILLVVLIAIMRETPIPRPWPRRMP